ncbi:MAG: hypothetical protein AABX73_00720 [Nanoarchaeota archaeon]|mgnify:CR=1 FL=1
MQTIGFNITKIHAERTENPNRASINNNIEFTNIEKEKIDILKDLEAIKIAFKYSLTYTNPEKKEAQNPEEKLAEVFFEGFLILSLDKEKAKEFHKAWKKKQIPKTEVIPLYNTILKRCTIKAATLQEELGLPSHLKIPQLKLESQ